ncbi:MAG: cytochrome c-type biogenesis protein CcmH [Rhodobacteraceae bacterium]|nr:cytochrome c-type biogenesis protein CcmH [Paracoccaceae bacterium]
MRFAWLICGIAGLAFSAVLAVEPGEILSDPELEQRARGISKNLRCLVCQNESIDESHAPLAGDLRILVREQLAAGKSDSEVYQYVTDRYGEFVLLKPLASGSNLIIYLAGPILLCFALVAAAVYVVRRQKSPMAVPSPLTNEERRTLEKITGSRLKPRGQQDQERA